mmetsp:Transcript_7293/g.24239  ORF Transcript_7293/g.24239 Transcript_7293/m.24239 type:complete len:168 (-) Transcript_7293:1204-1707(-)
MRRPQSPQAPASAPGLTQETPQTTSVPPSGGAAAAVEDFKGVEEVRAARRRVLQMEERIRALEETLLRSRTAEESAVSRAHALESELGQMQDACDETHSWVERVTGQAKRVHALQEELKAAEMRLHGMVQAAGAERGLADGAPAGDAPGGPLSFALRRPPPPSKRDR